MIRVNFILILLVILLAGCANYNNIRFSKVGDHVSKVQENNEFKESIPIASVVSSDTGYVSAPPTYAEETSLINKSSTSSKKNSHRNNLLNQLVKTGRTPILASSRFIKKLSLIPQNTNVKETSRASFWLWIIGAALIVIGILGMLLINSSNSVLGLTFLVVSAVGFFVFISGFFTRNKENRKSNPELILRNAKRLSNLSFIPVIGFFFALAAIGTTRKKNLARLNSEQQRIAKKSRKRAVIGCWIGVGALIASIGIVFLLFAIGNV